MLRWYQGALARRPVFVQSVTTAFLFGAGDVLAQQAVERTGFENHEWARTGRMVLYGGAVFGPGATIWYRILSSKINLASKQTTILARVAADQVIFTPINLTLFLSSMAFLEGWPSKQKTVSANPSGSKIPRSATEAKNEVVAVAEEVRAEVDAVQKGAAERISEKLSSTYWMALSRNWMIWPFVQLVNFSVVPLNHRVLVVNVVSLGWNCYLSFLNSGGGKEES